MTPENPPGVKSTAAIAGHPLHPAVIPFPIAFLIGAVVTDIIYVMNGDPFWAQASFWLIAGGIIMGLVAAVLGLTDFATIKQARNKVGWAHLILNVTAMGLSALNFLTRLGDPADSVMPLGLALSAVVGGILTVSGWLGGDLAYRYKIGVTGHDVQHAAAHRDGEEHRAYSGD